MLDQAAKQEPLECIMCFVFYISDTRETKADRQPRDECVFTVSTGIFAGTMQEGINIVSILRNVVYFRYSERDDAQVTFG